MALASPETLGKMVVEILEGYISKEAAQNLWRKATRGQRPTTPEAWAELLEGPLWAELRSILPFQSLPKELKALVQALREAARPAEAPPGGTRDRGVEPPLEPVDLEDPEARKALARRLARLEGVVGVVVSGPKEEEVLTQGLPQEILSLTGLVHRLLRRQAYQAFYLGHKGGLVLLRSLGKGYLALWAKKEANIGQLLHTLRRIVTLEEVRE